MIPFNYCPVCHATPTSKIYPSYCENHRPYHDSIYCSYCGTILNKLFGEPKPHKHILCSGCYHAFVYPRTHIKINEKTLPCLSHYLTSTQYLPIHIKQAYEQQYRLLVAP